jgi:hypothetical protein
MRRFACATFAGMIAGAYVSACGADASHKKPTGEPDSGVDSGSGGAGTGGAAATGGVTSTGGIASTGGVKGTGGITGSGGTRTDAGPKLDAGEKPDASVEPPDSSVNLDASADATCADPGCAWIHFGDDAGAGVFDSSGYIFTATLGKGAPKIKNATLSASFCECQEYGEAPCYNADPVPVTVSGGTLTADLSSLASVYSAAWLQGFSLTVETECGKAVTLSVSNDGIGPDNGQSCTDSFVPDSCTPVGDQ